MMPQSNDATLLASKHPNIVKRTSTSGLVISSALAVIGLVALVSANRLEEYGNVLSVVLMLSGTILIISGILQYFWKGKELVYTPTGSLTKERSLYFDLKHLDELKEYVTNGTFPVNGEIKSETEGNLRLDVILSQDNKFAAVQAFQFVPYAYNAITPIYYYTNGEATALAKFLVNNGYK